MIAIALATIAALGTITAAGRWIALALSRRGRIRRRLAASKPRPRALEPAQRPRDLTPAGWATPFRNHDVEPVDHSSFPSNAAALDELRRAS